MSSMPDPYLPPEQYLELEADALIKHEYVNGFLYAMAGASPEHNAISANMIISIGGRLKGRGCRVFTSDQRVRVPQTDLYTYPDLTVICGPMNRDDRDPLSLTNPTLLAEILSPSSEAWDRGAKFVHYQALDSLTDYLVVSQDQPRIERHYRQAEDTWLLQVVQGLDAVLSLPNLGLELPLAEVYDGIELPPLFVSPAAPHAF